MSVSRGPGESRRTYHLATPTPKDLYELYNSMLEDGVAEDAKVVIADRDGIHYIVEATWFEKPDERIGDAIDSEE